MILGNCLFPQRTDRFRSSSALFSRIAGFFKNVSPKTNIVSPMKEDDCEMVQGSSQSAAKVINNNIIDAFTVACSSRKIYEELEEEREVRSQRNFIRVRSNESTDEFDDDEEFFADRQLSLDLENSDISDSFSSVSLPILCSEQMNDGSSSDLDLARLKSGSSSGVSCTFDATTNVENVDDACVPNVEVASDLALDHQDTEVDAAEAVAAETDASVADATIKDAEKDHAATAEADENTAAKTDVPHRPVVTSEQEVCSRESLSSECPDFHTKDATTAADGATSDGCTATGAAKTPASDLSEQNEGCSYKDLPLDNETVKDTATETAVASIPDLSFHPEQSNSEVPSLPEYQRAEENVEIDDDFNTTEDISSVPCIEQEGRGSLDSLSSDWLLNKASDDYVDDSFESYTEKDQLPADVASSLYYNHRDMLKSREEENDILTSEEVREIIAAAKERLRQATDNVKSILKAKGNSSKFAKKNVRFAEYHQGPAYRQKANEDKTNADNFNSQNQTESTDCRSVKEMIAAAKQRLNFAADKVKDYVTGEGPRFQFRSAKNDAKTTNNVATVASQDFVSNALEPLENSHEEYAIPDSPVGIRKANSFTMFIPSGETSNLQRRNQHLFFQGKKHDEYDPYTDIDDHANEIYDQLNFDTLADSEAFSMQHGQESSVLTDSRTELRLSGSCSPMK